MENKHAGQLVWGENCFELNKSKTFQPSQLPMEGLETDGFIMEEQNFWKMREVWAAGGHEAYVKQHSASFEEIEKDGRGIWTRTYERGKMIKLTYTIGGRVYHYDPATGNELPDSARFEKHSAAAPQASGALAKLFDTADPRDAIDMHSIQAGRR